MDLFSRCWWLGHRTKFSTEETGTRWSPSREAFVPVGEYVCRWCAARDQTNPRPPYLMDNSYYGLDVRAVWRRRFGARWFRFRWWFFWRWFRLRWWWARARAGEAACGPTD